MKNRFNFKKMSLSIAGLASLLLTVPATAGKYVNPYTAEGIRANSPKIDEQWTWIIVGVLIFLVLVIAMILQLQNRLNGFIEKETAKSADPETLKYKSTWKELFLKPERDKPLDAPIEGHNYDGIVELDNNPPAWFNWLFFLPIAWGIGYVMYYHVLNIGELQDAEYATEMRIASGSQGGEDKEAALAKQIEELVPYTSEDKLALGEQVFTKNCAACHKPDGSGATGPNLTDNAWIHGGDFHSVFNTVYNGVPEKGMAQWKKLLKFDQVVQVTSYIDQKLRNTNAPGKDPEGEVYNGE